MTVSMMRRFEMRRCEVEKVSLFLFKLCLDTWVFSVGVCNMGREN